MKKISKPEGGIGRLALPIAIAAIAVIGAAGGILATHQGQGADAETESAIEETAAQEEAQTVSLTEHQAQSIAKYTTTEQDLIGTLKSGSWSSDSSTKVIAFGDDQYAIRSTDGSQEAHPYAVSSVEISSQEADGDVLKITTCAMETDIDTYVLTIQESSLNPGAMTISSKAFTPTTYVLTPSSHVISVEGVSSEVAASLGGDAEGISSTLSSFCTANFPAANKATCTGVVVTDLNEREATTTFTLDNSAKTKLTLTYDMQTKELAVSV